MGWFRYEACRKLGFGAERFALELALSVTSEKMGHHVTMIVTYRSELILSIFRYLKSQYRYLRNPAAWDRLCHPSVLSSKQERVAVPRTPSPASQRRSLAAAPRALPPCSPARPSAAPRAARHPCAFPLAASRAAYHRRRMWRRRRRTCRRSWTPSRTRM